jgi:SPP1 family phage portal protein
MGGYIYAHFWKEVNLIVTEELILLCLDELEKQAQQKQIYKDYYNGEHSILRNYDMQDSRSNQKLIFNFPRKFVDNETGYLLGKPVNYVSKSDDSNIIQCIDTNTSHWDKEHNITLRKLSEIYGESYELNYIDQQGDFSATILTPMDTYVLEDGTAERNVSLAVHKFYKAFDDGEYIDVYTDNEILHYQLIDGKLVYLDKHPHLFERVPVIICNANMERKSGFYDVISLIDAYNSLNSDLVNEISDHRNAYLIIENAKIEEEDLLKMKQMGIIQVPKGGAVKWLIKDINDNFVQNELENIERKIYDMMDEVNFNENWASNTSSLALRNKLLNLENRVAIREAFMEKVLRERLKNLFLFIKKKEGRVFDYRDIAIKFTRNLPTDLTGLADVITKLNGVCSKETMLTLLPFVESPVLELKKLKLENASAVSKDVAGAEESEVI